MYEIFIYTHLPPIFSVPSRKPTPPLRLTQTSEWSPTLRFGLFHGLGLHYPTLRCTSCAHPAVGSDFTPELRFRLQRHILRWAWAFAGTGVPAPASAPECGLGFTPALRVRLQRPSCGGLGGGLPLAFGHPSGTASQAGKCLSPAAQGASPLLRSCRNALARLQAAGRPGFAPNELQPNLNAVRSGSFGWTRRLPHQACCLDRVRDFVTAPNKPAHRRPERCAFRLVVGARLVGSPRTSCGRTGYAPRASFQPMPRCVILKLD